MAVNAVHSDATDRFRAKQEGRPMAVLNLNQMTGLYVTRAWHPSMEGSHELVAKVLPEVPA